MAAVTDQLLRRVLKIPRPFEAGILPSAVTTGHGRDIFISHFLEYFAGEQRTHPAGAIGDNRRVLIWDRALDFDFKKAAGQRHGIFQMAFAPFVFFPNIKNYMRLAVIGQKLIDLLSRDFRYLLTRIGHDFLKSLGHSSSA